MDYYLLLRLVHIVGFILLGGGLLAVFVSELRAYRTLEVHRFAEAAWYTATFYDALVLPGAVLVGLSGLLLMLELGLGPFVEPWLVGMWGLFLFEALEGNTITRRQFRRTLRHARHVLQSGHLTAADRDEARTWLGQVTHFLDLPLFLAIVYFGAMRPDSWLHVLAAIAIALVTTAILALAVPKLARPPEAMIWWWRSNGSHLMHAGFGGAPRSSALVISRHSSRPPPAIASLSTAVTPWASLSAVKHTAVYGRIDGMADQWLFKSETYDNCNCAVNCGCQFNLPSTHGYCQSAFVGNIVEGHFKDTPLAGLNWAALYKWPGEIKDGNGKRQIVIDERADEAQRIALETIISGEAGAPLSNLFSVFASTCSESCKTLFLPIDVEANFELRTARVDIPDVLKSSGRPIINEFTGQPFHIALARRSGSFEFTYAEIGLGTTSVTGEMEMAYEDSWAHYCVHHFNQDGLVRGRSRLSAWLSL